MPADNKSKKTQWSSQDLKALKVPPHSLEAEQSVIGGLMLDNNAWDQVADKVYEKDFYRQEHGVIFRSIQKLAEKDTPFDVITLSDILESEKQLENVGGLAYLGELAKNTPSVANIAAYADIVRERSVMRGLLTVSGEIADTVYHPEGKNSAALLDQAETKIFAIADQGRKGDRPLSAKEIMPEVIEHLEVIADSKDGITGIASHFSDLDRMTSGLQRGDMIVIAGRPSMGKTTLAMNIAENVAMEADKPVLIFSLEMPKESIMIRMLSSLARVDQTAIRSGQLEDHDWSRIHSAMTQISDYMNLYIDDSAALSPSEIRARARRLARERGGLSLIVIDYMQLMQMPGNNENRNVEVSAISRNLKALAKELHVPVIALSQLSRKSEERTDKRPMMSDLRESGAIEQDADVIGFVYRDEVYHPDTEEKGIAELIIGKQRNGPTGVVKLTFLGHYSRFDDYAPQQVF